MELSASALRSRFALGPRCGKLRHPVLALRGLFVADVQVMNAYVFMNLERPRHAIKPNLWLVLGVNTWGTTIC